MQHCRLSLSLNFKLLKLNYAKEIIFDDYRCNVICIL
jgi:hypothetical protein